MGGVGSFVRWERSGGWFVIVHLYEGSEVEDGRKKGVCAEETERMYGAVGENSIDFLKILYRLFRKTL